MILIQVVLFKVFITVVIIIIGLDQHDTVTTILEFPIYWVCG